MFTPKANSKQKYVKKTQERKTRDAVTPSKTRERKTRDAARLASKSLAMASKDRLLSYKTHFSPQNPNFESLKPKFDPMVCPNVYKHQKRLKTI